MIKRGWTQLREWLTLTPLVRELHRLGRRGARFYVRKGGVYLKWPTSVAEWRRNQRRG